MTASPAALAAPLSGGGQQCYPPAPLGWGVGGEGEGVREGGGVKG